MAKKTLASAQRRVDRWEAALQEAILEASAVEPDEQVRALGVCSLTFAEWSLAMIDLGEVMRRDGV